MGRTATFHGYKTRVGVGAANAYETDPTSLAGVTYLTELVSVSHTGDQVAKLTVTHLESPGGYQELLPGFGDGGTVELTFNYTSALYQILKNLAPDPSYQPVPAGANAGDPPRYYRRLLFVVDRFGNYLWVRVIFNGPTWEVGEDGKQMIKVTATVCEGYPNRVFVA